MSNIKITELNAAGSLAANDVLPVVDISTDETKKITSTNLFRTLPDGTAASPALAFGSDPANGIYLASSDTVGISTGGTQRVTVDASGNVVISGDLTVQGATTTVESTTVTIDDKNLELGSVASPSNTTADGGGITLKGASDKTIKWINSTGCWTFNQPTNFNDHVRITSAGLVGIGTASPSGLLHISGNTCQMHFTDEDDASSSRIYQSGATFAIDVDQANAKVGSVFAIRSDDQERLRIDSSGNVGIGTSSVAGKLHVFKGNGARNDYSSSADGLVIESSSSTGISIDPGAGNTANIYFPDAGNHSIGSISHNLTTGELNLRAATFLRFAGTSNTERMRIDSSGNVFIGGTTASSADIALNANGSITAASSAKFLSNQAQFALAGSAPYFFMRTGSAGGGAYVYPSTTGSKLFFNSNGNGIGTDTGNIALDTADGSITAAGNFLSTNASYGFTSNATSFPFTAESSLGNGGKAFYAKHTGSSSSSRYLFYGENNAGEVFNVAANGTATLAGNLGLGTSSPSQKLDVVGNSAALRVSEPSGAELRVAAGGSLGYFGTYSNHPLQIITNGQNAVRIDSSGNVGIGTSSITEKLHIGGGTNDRIAVSGSGSSGLLFKNTSGTDLFQIVYDDASSDNVFITTSDDLIFRNQAGTQGGTIYERMRIDSAGKVGIGTTSPSANLEVFASVNPQLRVNSTSHGYLDLSNYSNGAAVMTSAAHPLRLGTSNTERLRIDSSGRLLVGTSTASEDYNLQVNGIYTGAFVRASGSGGPIVSIKRTRGNLPSVHTIVQNNDSLGTLQWAGADGSTYISAASIEAKVDSTPGSNDMPGRLVFSTTADGASSPTERMRISSTGIISTYRYNKWLRSDGTTDCGFIGRGDQVISGGSNADFGISTGGGNLLFGSGGTTERARLDSSGRLLVGTSSTSNAATAVFQGNSSGSTGPAFIYLRRGSTPASTGTLGVIEYSDNSGNIGAEVFANRDGGSWTSGSSHPTYLGFSTTADGASSPTARLIINRNGEARIGHVDSDPVSGDRVHSIGDPQLGSVTSNLARLAIQERSGNWISFKDGGGTHYGTIARNGSGVSYGSNSDYRLKQNVGNFTNGITLLKQLRPVTYNWNELSGNPDTTSLQRGFLAHEVQEVEPAAVTGDKDEMDRYGDCYDAEGKKTQTNVFEHQTEEGETWTLQSEHIRDQQLDPAKLVPILTAALQEAIAKIETLETKVAALEAG